MRNEEFKELQEFEEFKYCPCSYGGFGGPFVSTLPSVIAIHRLSSCLSLTHRELRDPGRSSRSPR
jgi:hypothetical protein